MPIRAANLCSMLLTLAVTVLPATWPAHAQPAQAGPSGQPLHILVYGGTGMIGSRIVDEALRRGDFVTIVVRHAQGVAPRQRLTVLQGNVLDGVQVEHQIAGQDAVIEAVRASISSPPAAQSSGSAPPRRGGAQVPHFYRRVAQILVEDSRALGARAPRLLFVGGATTLEDSNGRPVLDEMPSVPKTSEFYTIREALEYLRTVHDVAWTVLTPPLQIAPGTRTGVFRLGGNRLIRAADGSSHISAEDFAVAMLDEAHHPAHVRARFTIGY